MVSDQNGAVLDCLPGERIDPSSDIVLQREVGRAMSAYVCQCLQVRSIQPDTSSGVGEDHT